MGRILKKVFGNKQKIRRNFWSIDPGPPRAGPRFTENGALLVAPDPKPIGKVDENYTG
jgi:hypothetical protein